MRALILAVLLSLAWPCIPVQAQSVETSSETDPAALEKSAKTAMRAKDWPLALSLWDRYVLQKPTVPLGHRRQGEVLRELGRGDEAIAAYRRAIELAPNDADGWNGLCWTQIVLNRPIDARPNCQKAVDLDQFNYTAQAYLGHTWLLQGDTTAAQEWYKKTLPNIPGEYALKDGPLADFDLFIGKGWQVDESRRARQWFEQNELRWQDVRRLRGEADRLEKKGKYREALPLAEKCLTIATQVLGETHPSVGIRLNDLAWLYNSMGQYARAEPFYVRALAISEKAEGPEHPSTATKLNNLAGLYESMGQHARAEPLYVRALAITEKTEGPEHPSTGIRLSSLAGLYYTLGRYAEAEPLLVRALAISEKVNGPDHPSTSTRLNDLAELYRTTGLYAKAEPLYVRALAIFEKADGPDHPSTGTTLNNLAGLYQAMGLYAKAEPLHVRALAISEKANGPDHPSTGIRLNGLAMLYWSMGQYAKAEPLFVRALAIFEKANGPDHPSTGISLNSLAMLYWSMGQYAKAEPLYLRALAISEKANGPDHPLTGGCLNNLARLYVGMDQYAKTEPLLLRAWRIANAAGNPELAWKVQRSLRVFYAKTHPELAIWYGKQAVNTLQAVRAANTALDKATQKSFLEKNESTYKDLADLLFAQGRLIEGQQVLALLKDAEYVDFVQRGADSRQSDAGFTAQERPWSERYEKISGQLASMSKEREALLKRVKNGEELAAAEQSRKEKLDADLALARQAYDAFLAELKKEFTQGASADRQQEFGEKNLTSLRALQGTLRDLGHGAVTLHYLLTDQRLWILLTTPTVQLKREAAIGAADLNRLIGEYRAAIARRDPQVKTQGKALYELLIAPVADDLKQAGAQTLMLSLDGALRYLPMAALYDGERFLAQRYQLALYTSAAKDKLKDKPQAEWTLAGYGLTQKVDDFAALPSVKGELDGILLGMKGKVSFDQAFTAASFKTGLEGEPPVVHLASHFVFKPGNETDSFLLLGDGKKLSLKQIKDGYEFVNLDLLTLSACETAVGGGKDANGREVEGFGALAQNQGAKGVIATLWPVADESTGQFMQLFYGFRQKNPGITKAEAMQMAQVAFIERRVAPALAEVSRGLTRTGAGPAAAATTDHPYYWAPFILMGNWL